MAYFQWTEAMSVGVPALDSDHRGLVRIINLLHGIKDEDNSSETIKTVLETLKLYGRFHFRREERVMGAIRFPGTAFHRSEHHGFTKYVADLQTQSSERMRDPRLAAHLFEYLTGWLRHHILIQDMAYKPYVGDFRQVETLASGAAPVIPNVAGLDHVSS